MEATSFYAEVRLELLLFHPHWYARGNYATGQLSKESTNGACIYSAGIIRESTICL